MRRVELVANPDMVGEQHGQNPHSAGTHIVSAYFPIEPEKCATAFGRWLAETIMTTRLDDDFSILRITLIETEEDLRIKELANWLTSIKWTSQDLAEKRLQELEVKIAHKREVMKMYGEALYRYHSFLYQWPVYGSRAAEGAYTPEAYFDLCARKIRMYNPRQIHCPSQKVDVPESLMRTMGGY